MKYPKKIVPFRGPSRQFPDAPRWRSKDGKKCKSYRCQRGAKEGPLQYCYKCIRRFRFGHNIYNDNLWSMRRHIRGVKLRQASGKYKTTTVAWLLECVSPGCTETYEYYNEHGQQRRHCSLHRRRNYRFRPYEAIFTMAQAANARRGIAWSLTYDQFLDICTKQKKCRYCDTEVHRTVSFRLQTRIAAATYLDRLDPLQGYQTNNVVTCCPACNATKSAMLSVQEMMVVGLMRQGRTAKAMWYLRRKQPPGNMSRANWAHTVQSAREQRDQKLRQRKPAAQIICENMRRFKIEKDIARLQKLSNPLVWGKRSGKLRVQRLQERLERLLSLRSK